MVGKASVPDGTTSFIIPVVHEQLHVDVRTVDTGRGVRIHKTVSEREQVVDMALAREAVEVARVTVDRLCAPGETPQARQEGDTWIVPVTEEVLVVEKRLRIKEEIHIHRTSRSERHADTVLLRTENVSIERFDDGPDSAATSQ